MCVCVCVIFYTFTQTPDVASGVSRNAIIDNETLVCRDSQLIRLEFWASHAVDRNAISLIKRFITIFDILNVRSHLAFSGTPCRDLHART